MATTVEIFMAGLPLDQVRERIEQCTGIGSSVDGYGVIDFPQPNFIASLSKHTYPEGGDIDVTSYDHELSAKNYWYPEFVNELDSDTVRWFRTLFACLQTRNELRLLLTYNIERVLDRFDPSD